MIRKIYWLAFLFLATIGLTLPFHYIPSALMMFPKDNMSFSYTIVTQTDIDGLVKRYNEASLFEKSAIQNEPLFRKLSEKGLISEIKIDSVQSEQAEVLFQWAVA